MAHKAPKVALARPVHRVNKAKKAILAHKGLLALSAPLVHRGQRVTPALKALSVLLVGIPMAMANQTRQKTTIAMANMTPLIVWARKALKARLARWGWPGQWARLARKAPKANKVSKAPLALLALRVERVIPAHKVRLVQLARKAQPVWPVGMPTATAGLIKTKI